MIKMNKIYMRRRNGGEREEGAHRDQKIGT
jgi:hypothetical protein